MKTIVLLSGGLDSVTVLAGCVASGDECIAVGIDYGQPHGIELKRAEDIAALYGVPFQRISLPAAMPKIDDVVFAGRNLVLAALAIAVAQANGCDRIAVGCNASDWARFPDCRPQFWSALRSAAEAYDVRISTPLLHSCKRDVVKAARKLGVPIDRTWSCYSPQNDQPCGACLACTTRQEALSCF